MQQPATEPVSSDRGRPDSSAGAPDRIERLKRAVQQAPPGICVERPLIWTRSFKENLHSGKSAPVKMAEALRSVLLEKTLRIYDDELIVGNFHSKRVGGTIFPELHGVPILEDLFRFSSRKTSPLQISALESLQLLSVVPFWAGRFLALKAHRSLWKTLRFIAEQLTGEFYLLNETGGISHIAPDYGTLVAIGTDGLALRAETMKRQVEPGSEARAFLDGVTIIAEGLALFGRRYSRLAARMAGETNSDKRRAELLELSRICEQVPARGARTFHEALQSLTLAQIALNLESLDNSVCPGRLDQILYPYYRADIEHGRLTRERAVELVAAFSIKLCELIPVFSERVTRFHGGMFNGQVVCVGGTDRDGNDATNELSLIFLDVMDRLRMRQPNFHARVHSGSPKHYLQKIYQVLAAGANSPALYNDEVIVETLVERGYEPEDARDYTAVGCVEPVCQGKSFSSTDAALVNVPILLELALNQGRRFGSRIRSGAKTAPIERIQSMQQLTRAFETQLSHRLGRLIDDLQAVERANREHHPTPLTSMLLDGCIESATCSTAGGARYNFSGVQCVGPADTGDSLFAIEQLVFEHNSITLPELVGLLKENLPDDKMRTRLRNLAKFGNDSEPVDRWTRYVIERFAEALEGRWNTRGGRYTVGLYSVTSHNYFGQITGALPSGRRKGEPFASGMAPANGCDRSGPTALLNSMNRLDFTRTANGINFNIKFNPHTLRGKTGLAALSALMQTYFKRGGMQVQVNVLDPEMLKVARDNPEQYPNLLVRVSGYSAYFHDLTPDMQDEIIRRSSLAV